jgi:hypothetical protein
MLDLDELKEKWTALNDKLDRALTLNRELLHATRLKRARSAMQRLGWFLIAEAVVWLAIIVALGSFIYEDLNAAAFALPAVALHVYAIANLVGVVWQAVLALQIDYAKPIAGIQRQLEGLRILRIRYIQLAVLTGTLMWTPFVIVFFKGVFGVDAYSAFGTAWLSANAVFTAVVVVLLAWLSRKFGSRMGHQPFVRRLMKDLAGHNLNAATEFLTTLSEFEDEKCEY